MSEQGKGFVTLKAAHAAVAKSPARGIRYSVQLGPFTLKDGSRVFRHFPTFRPATDEQRLIVTKAGYRCVDHA